MGITWRRGFCIGDPKPRTQNVKFKSICKICLNSVKRRHGRAIYIAECGHAFHFACLATHTTFVCPVCNATWKDLPILALAPAPHNNNNNNLSQQNDVVETTIETETTQQPQQPTHSDSLTSYNDDEPLPFLTTCTRIVPIPEADENAEQDDQNDDAGNLQGIFVNPKQINDDDSRIVRVKLMQECAVISLSRTHVTYALVLKLKAPPSPAPPHRAAIDLVAVLDVGASMSGPKLHVLKRAVRLVISSLGSLDRLAIVAFAGTSKRLLPLRRMTSTGQRVARRVVERLSCGQGNGVGEALMKASKVLEFRRERNPVASIILLTDGPTDERVQTGDNNTNQRKCFLHVSSTRFSHIEAPVHWFGLKTKPRAGEDDLAKCIGVILSVVVQGLRIQIGFEPGSYQAEISAVYSCSGPPTAFSVDDIGLGNMHGGKEKELLVEVRVGTSALGAHQVMKVRCMYKDPTGEEVVVHDREEAVTVVLPPERGVSCNGRVERIRNVLITRGAIAESRRLVKEEKKISSAHDLVTSARALMLLSGSGSGQEYVRSLEGELVELHRRKQQQEQTTVGEGEREVTLVVENGEGNRRCMVMGLENAM